MSLLGVFVCTYPLWRVFTQNNFTQNAAKETNYQPLCCVVDADRHVPPIVESDIEDESNLEFRSSVCKKEKEKENETAQILPKIFILQAFRASQCQKGRLTRCMRRRKLDRQGV